MSRSIATLALIVLLQGCALQPTPGAIPRSDELFSHVQAGMPQAEVRSLLGRPDNTMPFPASHTDSWGYYYWDTWGYYSEFSVTFDSEGRVLSKLSRRLNDGRSRD